jgi:hypothetical protein
VSKRVWANLRARRRHFWLQRLGARTENQLFDRNPLKSPESEKQTAFFIFFYFLLFSFAFVERLSAFVQRPAIFC